ncbi:MAG TPA: flagellar basal body-associated FliL family protein [Candidatus Binatia bacterium]|jgi:flagellar FliL protein
MIKTEFRKKTLLSALVVTLTLGLLGGVWLLAYEFFKPGAAAEQTEKHVAKKEATVEMEPFVVNLAGAQPARYLRASLSLVLNNGHDKQIVKQSSSRLRHELIMLLSSKTAEGLLAAEGKSELREEIIERINTAAGEELVAEVYFREFLIQ